MAEENDITGIKTHVLNAALSYMGVLVLLPIISGATANPFVKFHAKQGLVLLGGEVLAILASYWLSYLGGILFLLMLLFSIAGLYSSLREEKWHIPVVGILANLFTL
ncbi:MAG: hypothetical protein O3A36_03195 [bacterium]|nr:hypothetical protein [bacterium]